MKKWLALLIGILIMALAVPALAGKAEDFSSTINIYKKDKNVQWFFKNSYGYAVFPTIGKAGFVIGGSYGNGQVYRKGVATGKSRVIEGSIGFQLGGKAFSEMIFFQNKTAYDRFISGSFEFGANIQATILTAGAGAKAGTGGASAGASAAPGTGAQAETAYINGMAVFAQSLGGLMYEISIGGQKFSFEPF